MQSASNQTSQSADIEPVSLGKFLCGPTATSSVLSDIYLEFITHLELVFERRLLRIRHAAYCKNKRPFELHRLLFSGPVVNITVLPQYSSLIALG
jgi:hypothetical protein